ncbi:MAG TPA: carboxypeptidase-like regulatory domain-containing protein [Actinomycetota bacterium]
MIERDARLRPRPSRATIHRAVAIALLATIAVACSGSPTRSGVQGVVMAGPQCPVEQLGSPCPDQPFEGTVRASAQDGTIVGETQTDERGRFRIALEPGTYLIEVVVAAGGPTTSTPQPVRVEDGSFTRVSLQVDTGIR